MCGGGRISDAVSHADPDGYDVALPCADHRREGEYQKDGCGICDGYCNEQRAGRIP